MATLLKTSLLKAIASGHNGKFAACIFVQNRDITGKAMRASLPPPPKKPPPFDYVNKDYTWIHSLFDRTTHRFDDNTKVIFVEGPVASGKTEFASQLAADLGMCHFKEANMDLHYIRPNGIDLRIFNPLIPPDTRTFDHVDFCTNPTHRLAGAFQIMMYSARYSQYIDALTHLFNTGQGVVMERSPYSDFVFLEAMASQKFISKGVRSVYYDIRANTIDELLRPHLVIYLDVPVAQVQQKISSRGHPHEKKSPALTTKFLTEMERQYKNRYLRDISSHAELLIYDWSAGGDIEVVIEDIERINFDQYTEREEPKMKDWRFPRETEWADQRKLYTNQKCYLMNLFNVPRIDVPELITSADDVFAMEQVILNHPDFEFAEGYCAKDGLLAMKNRLPKYTSFF